jgi:glutathione peroxidase
MKSLRIFLILLYSSISAFSQTNSSFHDFEVRTILGDTISLSQFAGKKVMVVNTASFCSYTFQYGLLESLREQYSTAYNFEILGFPCNDFGNQEPGHDTTILEFCTNTYNVQFPMMSSIHIQTGDTAAVYKWLQRAELNGV